MGKRAYSKYQQKVIDRYYEHRDTIMLQKLQELTTELYLAQDGPQEDRLWQRVEKAMINLQVKPALREHIMRRRRVEVLAENLQDWLKATP